MYLILARSCSTNKLRKYDLMTALPVPAAAKPALPGSAIEVVSKESGEREHNK